MDKAADDLNKVTHLLLAAQTRLVTVQAQRIKIEKDISVLTMIQANLEENIRFLKKKRTVAMINEFKKASEDLQTAKTRLNFLNLDRNNVLKVEKHLEKIYNNIKIESEQAFRRIHSPPDNLIPIDFSKRKNGK